MNCAGMGYMIKGHFLNTLFILTIDIVNEKPDGYGIIKETEVRLDMTNVHIKEGYFRRQLRA